MKINAAIMPVSLSERLGGASSIQFPFRVFRAIRTTGRDLAVSAGCVGKKAAQARQIVMMTGAIEGADRKLAVAVADEAELDYRQPIPIFLNFGLRGRNVFTLIEPGAERETIYSLLPLEAKGDQVLPCGRGECNLESHKLDLIHQIAARYGFNLNPARQFLTAHPQVLLDYSIGGLTLSRLESELAQHFHRRG